MSKTQAQQQAQPHEQDPTEFQGDGSLFDLLTEAAENHVPMSEIERRAAGATSIVTVKQSQTTRGKAPANTADGMFYSVNTAMIPTDALYVVIAGEDDTQLNFDKLGAGAKPICACPSQTEGVGYPYETIDGVWRQNMDKPRFCAYCPHNRFRAGDKKHPIEPMLQTDQKCKGKVTLTTIVLDDIDNISFATIYGVKMQFGSGMLSPDYSKWVSDDGQWMSWPAMANAMLRAKDTKGRHAPVKWTNVIFEMRTREFEFKVGKAYMPIVKAVRVRGVLETMKELVGIVMPQLALTSGIEAAALVGDVDEPAIDVPVMTGPQQ